MARRWSSTASSWLSSPSSPSSCSRRWASASSAGSTRSSTSCRDGRSAPLHEGHARTHQASARDNAPVLFPKHLWGGLSDGSVTVAFRYFKRATVKGGGTLVTPVGVLAIEAVRRVNLRGITAADARAAGYPSRAAIVADLGEHRRPATALHRIDFHYAGQDPRRALRDDDQLDDDELARIHRRLASMDRHRPWTRDMLELIRDNPAIRAPDLAASRGRETLPFKADVRKLKALGLTESLPIGYRLSPRGRVVLEALSLESCVSA